MDPLPVTCLYITSDPTTSNLMATHVMQILATTNALLCYRRDLSEIVRDERTPGIPKWITDDLQSCITSLINSRPT